MRRCATCATKPCVKSQAPRRRLRRSLRRNPSSEEGTMKHTYLAIAAAAIFALGCETAPKDEGALTEARSAVAQAEADPNVTKYAATELDRARKLLTNAEAAANGTGTARQTAAHYAYLATQVARIAEQRAHAQVATERI